MRKTTSDYSKRQAEYQRKRRAKRKAAGLCVQCGELRAHGVSPVKGRPYVTCEFCREKATLRNAEHAERKKQKSGKQDESKPVQCHPFTMTGKHYRCTKTGQTGVIVPCPCPDPIILQFKDGKRDAFHLRNCAELEYGVSLTNEYLYAIVPILQYIKKIYQPYKEAL